MDLCFDEAIKLFLEQDRSISMIRTNIGSNKTYSDAYKNTAANIFLDKDTCEKIYQSKYVQHFYSQEMINGFLLKWNK